MSRPGICVLITTMLLIITAASAADEVESLRGATDIDENSVEPVNTRWQNDKEPIARDFVQQPPLVPHTIDKQAINLSFNKCLTCHSWEDYRDAGATKISQTHFADREGVVQANVVGQRYFCKQCHVSQKDAEPLVENDFESLKIAQE
jgi:cytochrome c-type protein NapB